MNKLAIVFGILLHWSYAGAQSKVSATTIRLGSDRLLESPYLEQIQGLRLAVLAHSASVNATGANTVDRLFARTDLSLKMIFSPEHGFRGLEDDRVVDSVDPHTGLPVYSLYGPRRAPTPALLSGVDAVVVDLQDVGVRYYTYPATVAYTLQAAKAAGKSVFVLDRPIPIGGEIVEGAVLEPSLATGGLTTIAPIPTRHGLTLGEMSMFLNQAMSIGANLTVVPMTGWSRDMRWQDTGLSWMPPSPALVQADQTELYAALGTLESMNLAVGRGQTNALAFHAYGAPWITADESAELARRLEALALPGLRFSAYQWTPDRREYQGQPCRGVWVDLVDRSTIEGFRSLLEVVTVMRSVLGTRLDLTKSDVMLGARWLREGLENGESVGRLHARALMDHGPFFSARQRVLLYP